MKNYILLFIAAFFMLSFQGKSENNALQPKSPRAVSVKKTVHIDSDSVRKISFNPIFKSKYTDRNFKYVETEPEKSFWQQLKEWLSDLLAKYLDKDSNPQLILSRVFNVIAILIIVFVVYLIVKSILNREGQWVFGKNSDKKIIQFDAVESNLLEVDFKKLVAETLATGNKQLTIRYYYLWVLKSLSAKEVIIWDVEKTNSDYLNEIKNPLQKQNFSYLSYLYNYNWYGKFEMNDIDFQKAINVFQTTIQNLK